MDTAPDNLFHIIGLHNELDGAHNPVQLRHQESAGNLFHVIGLHNSLDRAHNAVQLLQQESPDFASRCLFHTTARSRYRPSRNRYMSDSPQDTTCNSNFDTLEEAKSSESENEQVATESISDSAARGHAVPKGVEDGNAEQAISQSIDTPTSDSSALNDGRDSPSIEENTEEATSGSDEEFNLADNFESFRQRDDVGHVANGPFVEGYEELFRDILQSITAPTNSRDQAADLDTPRGSQTSLQPIVRTNHFAGVISPESSNAATVGSGLSQAPHESPDNTLVGSDDESVYGGLDCLTISMIKSFLEPPLSRLERHESSQDESFIPAVVADNEHQRQEEKQDRQVDQYHDSEDLDFRNEITHPSVVAENERQVERHQNSHDLDFEDDVFKTFVVAEQERLELLRLDMEFFTSYRSHEHRFLGPMVQPWPLTRPGERQAPKKNEYLDIPCFDGNARRGYVFRIQIAELLYQLHNPYCKYLLQTERQARGEPNSGVMIRQPPIPPVVRTDTTRGVELPVTADVWHFILQNVGDEWRPCFQKTWDRYMPRYALPSSGNREWNICSRCNEEGVEDGRFYTLRTRDASWRYSVRDNNAREKTYFISKTEGGGRISSKFDD